MIPKGAVVGPPRLAAWLVDAAAPRPDAEAVLGDLAEEFAAIEAREGPAPAKRWYWRQTPATVWHLSIGEFRRGPWVLVGVGVAANVAFIVLEFTNALAMRAVVTRFPIYAYVSAPWFWRLSDFIPAIVCGLICAKLDSQRGVRPVVAFGFVFALVMGVFMPLRWLRGMPDTWSYVLFFAIAIPRLVRDYLLFTGSCALGALAGRRRRFADSSSDIRPRLS
jgi:hypothetical protein